MRAVDGPRDGKRAHQENRAEQRKAKDCRRCFHHEDSFGSRRYRRAGGKARGDWHAAVNSNLNPLPVTEAQKGGPHSGGSFPLSRSHYCGGVKHWVSPIALVVHAQGLALPTVRMFMRTVIANVEQDRACDGPSPFKQHAIPMLERCAFQLALQGGEAVTGVRPSEDWKRQEFCGRNR